MENIAFTADQVAQLLNISTITVRRHTTSGIFPCHRIGRLVRYTREDIDNYLAKWKDAGYDY